MGLSDAYIFMEKSYDTSDTYPLEIINTMENPQSNINFAGRLWLRRKIGKLPESVALTSRVYWKRFKKSMIHAVSGQYSEAA